MPSSLPELPYAYDALEPQIDAHDGNPSHQTRSSVHRQRERRSGWQRTGEEKQRRADLRFECRA
jgi:superoxide dismutase